MLLCAKHGRGKLVRAKLLTGGLFAVGAVATITAASLVVTALVFGLEGLFVPVQLLPGFGSVPFSFTILQYLLAQVGFQLMGGLPWRRC